MKRVLKALLKTILILLLIVGMVSIFAIFPYIAAGIFFIFVTIIIFINFYESEDK